MESEWMSSRMLLKSGCGRSGHYHGSGMVTLGISWSMDGVVVDFVTVRPRTQNGLGSAWTLSRFGHRAGRPSLEGGGRGGGWGGVRVRAVERAFGISLAAREKRSC